MLNTRFLQSQTSSPLLSIFPRIFLYSSFSASAASLPSLKKVSYYHFPRFFSANDSSSDSSSSSSASSTSPLGVYSIRNPNLTYSAENWQFDSPPNMSTSATNAPSAASVPRAPFNFYSNSPSLESLQGNPAVDEAADLTKTPCPHKHPLHFQLDSADTGTPYRAATLTLPHGPVQTPVFMPVGTQGAMKGVTSEQMSELGHQIILNNTYHLALRPGPDSISQLGGTHEFMNWRGNVLTDSGGFQMVSLVELSKVTEVGVEFASPIDGTKMLLTPEKSIKIQNLIGADIMMALDDVISSVRIDSERFLEAMHRTIRWIDRCIKAHSRPTEQNLYGIVQGGLDPELREFCLTEMMKRDHWLPGYAIGGLAGGESKYHFWRVVYQCCQRLPRNKPRYLMGVGYPLDLVVCVALGVDQFDCVYPCRTARFGNAIVPEGIINLRKIQYLTDNSPLDPNCHCSTCKKYSRAYLSRIASRTAVGCQLITIHNLYYIKSLMNSIRLAIIENRYPEFVLNYLSIMFPNKDLPGWVYESMKEIGILNNINQTEWTHGLEEAKLELKQKSNEFEKEERKKKKLEEILLNRKEIGEKKRKRTEEEEEHIIQ